MSVLNLLRTKEQRLASEKKAQDLAAAKAAKERRQRLERIANETAAYADGRDHDADLIAGEYPDVETLDRHVTRYREYVARMALDDKIRDLNAELAAAKSEHNAVSKQVTNPGDAYGVPKAPLLREQTAANLALQNAIAANSSSWADFENAIAANQAVDVAHKRIQYLGFEIRRITQAIAKLERQRDAIVVPIDAGSTLAPPLNFRLDI